MRSPLDVKIQEKALQVSGSERVQNLERPYFETGLDIVNSLRKVEVPKISLSQLHFEIENLSLAENEALTESLTEPQIRKYIHLYGSSTIGPQMVRSGLGESYASLGDTFGDNPYAEVRIKAPQGLEEEKTFAYVEADTNPPNINIVGSKVHFSTGRTVEEEMVDTIAHESTHIAIQRTVGEDFLNESSPYYNEDAYNKASEIIDKLSPTSQREFFPTKEIPGKSIQEIPGGLERKPVFRLAHDIDIQMKPVPGYENFDAAENFASSISERLNRVVGSEKYWVNTSGASPKVVYKNSEGVIKHLLDIHVAEEPTAYTDVVTRDIRKLGYNPLKPNSIEGLDIARPGQTLVDKGAIALSPTRVEGEFQFNPGKRVKDVLDTINISKILDYQTGGKFAPQIEEFSNLAVEKGLITREMLNSPTRVAINMADLTETENAMENAAAEGRVLKKTANIPDVYETSITSPVFSDIVEQIVSPIVPSPRITSSRNSRNVVNGSVGRRSLPFVSNILSSYSLPKNSLSKVRSVPRKSMSSKTPRVTSIPSISNIFSFTLLNTPKTPKSPSAPYISSSVSFESFLLSPVTPVKTPSSTYRNTPYYSPSPSLPPKKRPSSPPISPDKVFSLGKLKKMPKDTEIDRAKYKLVRNPIDPEYLLSSNFGAPARRRKK